MLAANEGDGLMRIEFVMPDKPAPPAVDVTPQAEPDYNKPALPAPTSRTVNPGNGIGPWRIDDDGNTGWMK